VIIVDSAIPDKTFLVFHCKYIIILLFLLPISDKTSLK